MEKILDKTDTEQSSQFLNELNTLNKTEDKLRFCLDFMRKNLSSDTTPVFRDFWEAKRLCLEFFKEKITPHVRTALWAEYIELSDAMRQVKQVLDEQSSFSEEQIVLALDALEKDLQNVDALLNEMNSVEIPEESKFLQKNAVQYIAMQRELELYNTFSGRLNSLRKELIQTQMRIRSKNRLFEHLSKLGDLVFPKRKEGIKILSDFFIADIERFINDHFELAKGPYFGLKDEIRALQKFAKALSINTGAFNQSRERLSACWDQIKDKEAQHRQQRAQQKERFKEGFDQLAPKIEEFKQECAEYKLSVSAADEKISALLSEMRELHFGQDEIKGLKKQLFEAKALLEEKEKEEGKKRAEAEEFEQKRLTLAHQILLGNIGEVLDQAEVISLIALVEKWEAFLKEGKTLKISGIEKAVLENRLDTIADHIQEKRWKSLLEENGEDLASSLNMLLNQRHKEKRKIKEALEGHRKLVGGSSLNLEQSMQYQELIREEKNRLDTIETMVEEIEEKLYDIEGV